MAFYVSILQMIDALSVFDCYFLTLEHFPQLCSFLAILSFAFYHNIVVNGKSIVGYIILSLSFHLLSDYYIIIILVCVLCSYMLC